MTSLGNSRRRLQSRQKYAHDRLRPVQEEVNVLFTRAKRLTDAPTPETIWSGRRAPEIVVIDEMGLPADPAALWTRLAPAVVARTIKDVFRQWLSKWLPKTPDPECV